MLRIPHSAMWTSVFLVACIAVATVRTSDLIGRLCCEENQVLRSGACVRSNNATSFSPPFYANLSQPLEIIGWRFQPLVCPYGHEREYFPLNGANNSLEIEEDGIYLRRKDIFVYKSSPDFCVGLDADRQNQYIAAFCLPAIEKICKEQTCVQKCCPEEEVLSAAERRCIKQNGTKFSPEFGGFDGTSVEAPKDLFVVDGLPECDLLVILNPKEIPEHRFFLLQNGILYEPYNHEEYKATTYCLDFFAEVNDDVALVCREPQSRALEIKNQLQTIGLMLSCIFLSLTILLHLAIPTLRDMQSLCFLCHMVSLLVADAVLFTGSQFSQNMSHEHCIANAFILQFSFLATFFWLNVMCFDIWRNIKAAVNSVRFTGMKFNEKKIFFLYSAYAWGFPLVIVIVTAVLHFLPDHLLYDEAIRPGFGAVSCWFIGDYALLSYFYGFVGVLFLANLVLLGHTIVMMTQAGIAFNWCCCRDTSDTASNRNHFDAFWQRFSLFCLMALCWVTEILSWKIYPHEIWIPTDIINSLQGFLVFVIFISSKKKREAIYNLWKSMKSSVVLGPRRIFRADTMKVIWQANDDQVKTEVEEASQAASRAEKPSDGNVNQSYGGSEQNKNGE